MGSIDRREYFGVSLLQIRTAIGLTEHTQLALDTTQLPSPSTVQSQPLVTD